MALDVQKYRSLLLAERDEITSLQSASADERAPVELDQQSVGRLSRMDALQQQSMALAEERRRGVRLKQIAAAFARMDDDEYGYCVACGEEIVEKRLDLDPAAAVCTACASAREVNT